MPEQPAVKRAIAFIDGQNLFYAAKAAYGYSFPNYDPLALASAVCAFKGWQLTATHFYTGIPTPADNPFWNHFWTAKLAVLGTRGVRTFTRPLHHRQQTSTCRACGATTTLLVGQEKGIDVRLALDVVRFTRQQALDVAVVFSQDQDLNEVADEVRAISRSQQRWIKIASAFPLSNTSRNRRGINRTDWVPIDRTMYDACIDQQDYRPKRSP